MNDRQDHILVRWGNWQEKEEMNTGFFHVIFPEELFSLLGYTVILLKENKNSIDAKTLLK